MNSNDRLTLHGQFCLSLSSGMCKFRGTYFGKWDFNSPFAYVSSSPMKTYHKFNLRAKVAQRTSSILTLTLTCLLLYNPNTILELCFHRLLSIIV
ncbi:hypothetical protein ACTXT7_016164 [Hymenolepis weldensis]